MIWLSAFSEEQPLIANIKEQIGKFETSKLHQTQKYEEQFNVI